MASSHMFFVRSTLEQNNIDSRANCHRGSLHHRLVGVAVAAAAAFVVAVVVRITRLRLSGAYSEGFGHVGGDKISTNFEEVC